VTPNDANSVGSCCLGENRKIQSCEAIRSKPPSSIATRPR